MASILNAGAAQTIIFRNNAARLFQRFPFLLFFLGLLNAKEHVQKPRFSVLTTVTAARKKELNGCLKRVKSICLLSIN